MQRYKHLWSDVTFEENVYSGYAMISYTALGKPGEDIIFYQCKLSEEVELTRGVKIPVLRNVTTISDLIEVYQDNKQDISSFVGMEYPTDKKAYIEDTYLILHLASDIQAYMGWFEDGYPPEEYTLTELKRLLGGYK